MAYLLSLLPLLACPLGMGLMMWMMGRGAKGKPADAPAMTASHAAAKPAVANVSPDDRLSALRARLSATQARQEAIAAQISQFSSEDGGVEPRAGSSLTAQARG